MDKNLTGQLTMCFCFFGFSKLYLLLDVILPIPYGLAGCAKAFCTNVIDGGRIMCGFPVLRKGQGVISNQFKSI